MDGTMPTAVVEDGKVFRYWFGVGTGCKLGCSDAISDETLVRRDPGIELVEWLLKMEIQIIVEDVPPGLWQPSNMAVLVLVTRLA